jgi:predicted TIM-barrel fold metal-dependent hydrolase
MGAPLRTDVHQHLWPVELLEALAARGEPPFARRDGGSWRLHVPGEPPSVVVAQEPAQRAASLVVDRALLSLSTALEVERLAPDEAAALLSAWSGVAAALPASLAAWASVNLASATPDDLDALLDEGFVGLCLPAAALAHPRRVEGLGALLERLEARGAPLFVHPGPAHDPDHDGAPWWPALTAYIASLQAAWWAWAAVGLAAHPRLRVVFAALAGLAPLHGERAAARGGPAVPRSPHLFYDTSSYGPDAITAVSTVVGARQLVHGSDIPVLDAGTPNDDAHLRENPERLLG